MEHYERKDISEAELEDRIRLHPDLIEEGLVFVDRQRRTPRGPLDLLLVDSKKTLVVAELKVVEDDNVLMQTLDYYDYTADKIDTIKRIYKNHNIDSTQMPRLMLIAPSFSHQLVNRCKWITEDIQISLYAYQYIKFEDGKKETIVYVPVEITPRVLIEKEAPSIDGHINYILSKEAKILAKKIIDEIQSWDTTNISISSKQWGVSIKLNNSVIAYWEPRKNAIRVSTIDKDGEWKGYNINTQEEYKNVIEAANIYYKSLLNKGSK